MRHCLQDMVQSTGIVAGPNSSCQQTRYVRVPVSVDLSIAERFKARDVTTCFPHPHSAHARLRASSPNRTPTNQPSPAKPALRSSKQ